MSRRLVPAPFLLAALAACSSLPPAKNFLLKTFNSPRPDFASVFSIKTCRRQGRWRCLPVTRFLRARAGGGLGINLSLSMKLFDLHGGRSWVESENRWAVNSCSHCRLIRTLYRAIYKVVYGGNRTASPVSPGLRTLRCSFSVFRSRGANDRVAPIQVLDPAGGRLISTTLY